ncbi:MAG: tRNA-dihydrouridine synthase [Patescibacteria group bacterium]|jgi:nifR3 family TIM-barrel protein
MTNFWQKLNKPGLSGRSAILALAPMAGVSNSAFRQLNKSFGADVLYTEMVSADALYYSAKKTLALLKFEKSEKPIVCQLFGKRPEMFPAAVKIVEQAGFSGVDLNFGCPAKKVVAHGGGITLMRDLKHCRRLIEIVLENTKLPVSVKIRSGIDGITALDFVKAISDLPVAALMIHGRPFKNPYGAPIDYEMIKKVKQAFPGLVLGNGGINQPEDAKLMLEKTGVDGVGLARGLYGQPWLFKQTKDYLKTGKYQELNFSQIKKVAIRHATLAEKAKGKQGIIETRKHLAWYVRGFAGAAELRAELVRVETIKQIKQILSKPVPPSGIR